MTKRDFRKVLVRPTTSIQETIRVMDGGKMGIVLVVDAEGRLLGTVTDGDIRRAILRGLRLEDPVKQVMHDNPITTKQGSPREDSLLLMRQREIQHIPTLDEFGRVVGLELLSELIGRPREKENWVVILAGGPGTRLRPLTEDTPKPLLKVGDRTLLEVLIGQVTNYGFRNFLIAVNYRAEMIQSHLGNGDRLGVNIRYLHEQVPLGTVGAVRLAQAELTRPFLVVNGDLLTKVNFEHLLDFHQLQKLDVTVGVKEYEVRIPYGVVQLSNDVIYALEEKPCKSYFVSAGIYALDPSVIALIPEAQPYDMTGLIQAVLNANRKVGGFPIHEYWLDVGQPADYQRACVDLAKEAGGQADDKLPENGAVVPRPKL